MILEPINASLRNESNARINFDSQELDAAAAAAAAVYYGGIVMRDTVADVTSVTVVLVSCDISSLLPHHLVPGSHSWHSSLTSGTTSFHQLHSLHTAWPLQMAIMYNEHELFFRLFHSMYATYAVSLCLGWFKPFFMRENLTL